MKTDWEDYPVNAVVNWPRDEKIIGVLGLGPQATADFYRKLCARNVRKDWEHPRVIIDSNPKIPSRGRCLELGEADPVPFMRYGIAALAEQGAGLVAVPCNTAHIFYERYAADSPVELPNIIEISSLACARLGARRVLVLASRLTIAHGLYQRALNRLGLVPVTPDEQGQILVGECIEGVKRHGPDEKLEKRIKGLLGASGADACVLGCTELPMLFPQGGTNGLPCGIVDSNQELADWCFAAAQGRKAPGHES